MTPGSRTVTLPSLRGQCGHRAPGTTVQQRTGSIAPGGNGDSAERSMSILGCGPSALHCTLEHVDKMPQPVPSWQDVAKPGVRLRPPRLRDSSKMSTCRAPRKGGSFLESLTRIIWGSSVLSVCAISGSAQGLLLTVCSGIPSGGALSGDPLGYWGLNPGQLHVS